VGTEYRGDLGIALSDVYGMDAFLRDFDMYFCKLFDGARHDSGDPILWGERLIEHYERNRVDPRTKTLVFSDSLDFRVSSSCIRVSRTGPHRLRRRHQPDQRSRLHAVADRHQDGPLQRPAGREAVGFAEKNLCDDTAYLAYLRQVFEISAPTQASSSN